MTPENHMISKKKKKPGKVDSYKRTASLRAVTSAAAASDLTKYRPVRRRMKIGIAELLVTGGVLAAAIAVAVSLFVYFHPFLKEAAKGLYTYGHSCIVKLLEWENQLFAQAEEENTAQAAGSKEENETPYITRTADMGEISSFWDEPYVPPVEDAIYSFMLDTTLGPLLYYNQGDSRWRDYLYGNRDPMSKYGCGPTCVAMVINSFGTTSVTPVEMADWAAANGGYAVHSGSYHNLIPDSLSAYGLQVEGVTDRSAEHAAELLRTGHILIALMGKGALTQNGHFIIIAQLDSDGTVYIADPANYENCTKKWDLHLLMDELKSSYDSGGPLWSVSLPSGETE